MSNNSIHPEDILPDGVDSTVINGNEIRKGTIAAFLANVEIFESAKTTAKHKQAALATMKELAPAVIIIGLYKHVVFKNPQVEKILAAAEADG